MSHVQTVIGRIDPAALGVTLPHEHTQIALWHSESRWDMSFTPTERYGEGRIVELICELVAAATPTGSC